jgi:hypothetical protein
VALAVGQWKPKGGSLARKPKPRRECWNCGDKGHFRSKCPKPLKSTNTKPHDPKIESSNVVIGLDDQWEEGAFSVEDSESWDDYDEDMPALEYLSDDNIPDLQYPLKGQASGE